MYDLVQTLVAYGETVDKLIAMSREAIAINERNTQEVKQMRDTVAFMTAALADLEQQVRNMKAQRDGEIRAAVGCEADAELHRPDHPHGEHPHGGSDRHGDG